MYIPSLAAQRESSEKRLLMKILPLQATKKNLFFLIDKNKACTPEKDEIAKPFMDYSNQFSISLLKGKTTGEAYEDTKRKYNGWICYFAAKEYLPEASSIISCLIWNRDSFILHGNKEKRIFYNKRLKSKMID